jgi:hypothetical protein
MNLIELGCFVVFEPQCHGLQSSTTCESYPGSSQGVEVHGPVYLLDHLESELSFTQIQRSVDIYVILLYSRLLKCAKYVGSDANFFFLLQHVQVHV